MSPPSRESVAEIARSAGAPRRQAPWWRADLAAGSRRPGTSGSRSGASGPRGGCFPLETSTGASWRRTGVPWERLAGAGNDPGSDG